MKMFYKPTPSKVITTISVLVAILFSGIAANTFASKTDYKKISKMRIPSSNKSTPDRIALGKALFFDPRLSGSNWVSCGTCHNPALGWSDGLPTALGTNMKKLERATPTILNAAYNRRQMWDGRSRTLEHQATGPIEADVEMNQSMPALVEELKSIPGYVKMFEKAYPGKGINKKTIGKAIAAFERTIISNNTSAFDRWLKGDEKAISVAAKRGFKLFDGKARCNMCHQGFNFTDDGFHNIGLPNNTDLGRYKLARVRVLKGAFKTPTLRNIAKTAPYMHNGSYKTLHQVVEHYSKGGVDKSNLSPSLQATYLSANERRDIVEFLKTLSEAPTEFPVPVLP